MPELIVDIGAIGANAEAVATLLRSSGLNLVGVTKGCLGEPRVAAAMLDGGAVGIADTRSRNLHKLRAALPEAELHRIHLPSLAMTFEPGDVTYVSSWESAAAVAALAGPGRPRAVVVLVETGDEREGVPLETLRGLVAEIVDEPRLHLAGLATNFACLRGGPEGIRGSLERIAGAAVSLRAAGFAVERVSGGNSSTLWMLVEGEELPAEVTELRCGEALLLGQDALYYRPLPGCRTDTCVVRAEVVEEYTRMTTEGPARRLVLAVGKQDLSVGLVKFLEPDLREIGRCGEYLVVEAGAEWRKAPVGTMVDMIPSYEALVAAWTSPYVDLRFQHT